MTQFFFEGRNISIPGAYGAIKSGITNPPLNLGFGNLLVIDTGSGAGYGGGSGVSGALQTGKDSLYTFDSIRDFQDFIKGGLWWLLSGPLFVPANGENGVGSITYVRAATTTSAQISYTFTGGGANGGTIIFNPRDEGRVANGVEGDETAALGPITITNAGGTGDTVTAQVDGLTIGSYTVQALDTIAEVTAGLAASIDALTFQTGYSVNAFDTGLGTINVNAIAGLGASGNSLTMALVVTGTVAGTGGSFASGVDGTTHTRGYAARMVAGEVDPSKFILEFYVGKFKGLDDDIAIGSLSGEPYDNVAELVSGKDLLVSSIEFATIQELEAWATTDSTFNTYFSLFSSVQAGDGSIDAADLTANAGNNLAVGGTETFGTTELNDTLDAIEGLNFDFILADKWGDDANSTENNLILTYINSDAQIKPDMYVGGGEDDSEWSQAGGSIPIALAYDSQFVTVAHGGVKIAVNRGDGFKRYDSIYHAAASLGREAGLAPQVPLSFKNLAIDGVLHPLKDSEVRLGLQAGVIMTRDEGGSFDIVKGINSLQSNDNLINEDGTTSSKQLRRISRQINKELTIDLKNTLLKQPNGPNRNTVSLEDVVQRTKIFLQNREARDTADNLILSFQNVSARFVQDAIFVEYSFVPNFEVNFIFSTGFIIDPQT